MLVISQSSTAGTLAVANDNVFRLTPSDALEATALVGLMKADGVIADAHLPAASKQIPLSNVPWLQMIDDQISKKPRFKSSHPRACTC